MRPSNPIRPAIFHPAAREALQRFPLEARRQTGQAIWELQQGKTLGMPLSRPMLDVAPGVAEIRVKDRSGAYRTFYLAVAARGLLVFHAFGKKSQQTPAHEIRLARARLREMTHG